MCSDQGHVGSHFTGYEIRPWNLSPKSKTGPVVCQDFQKVAVDKSGLFALIHCIVELEDLPSKERIISINQADNLSIRTIGMNSIIDVIQGFFVDAVDENLYFFYRNFLLFDVLSNEFPRPVFWGIVDVNHVIVLVVLHENRV